MTRELDAQVAEEVMGIDTSLAVIVDAEYKLPHYSSRIQDAWLVKEKMDEKGYTFYFEGDGWALFIHPDRDEWFDAESECDAESICLAALEAVRGEQG